MIGWFYRGPWSDDFHEAKFCQVFEVVCFKTPTGPFYTSVSGDLKSKCQILFYFLGNPLPFCGINFERKP